MTSTERDDARRALRGPSAGGRRRRQTRDGLIRSLNRLRPAAPACRPRPGDGLESSSASKDRPGRVSATETGHGDPDGSWSLLQKSLCTCQSAMPLALRYLRR